MRVFTSFLLMLISTPLFADVTPFALPPPKATTVVKHPPYTVGIYPTLWPAAQPQKWLIIKCKLLGVAGTGSLPPGFPSFVSDFDSLVAKFLTDDGRNTGNLLDYYRQVTYGQIQLTTSVLGWYQATSTSSVTTSGQRTPLVQDCANAAPESELSDATLQSLSGIIVVVNGQISSGAGFVGKSPLSIHGKTYMLGNVAFDSGSMYTAFAAHEVGHGLGLQHSRNSAGVQYGDPYDLMSAFSTLQFLKADYPAEGGDAGAPGAGPGLNLPNLMVLNAIPAARLVSYAVGLDGTKTFQLATLSHPTPSKPIGVKILWNEAIPGIPITISPPEYTIEYRQNDGWDAGFAQPVVLVHRVHPENAGYPWLSDLDAVLTVGQTFQASIPPNINFKKQFSQVYITVKSISSATGTATVQVSLQGPPSSAPPPR